MMQHLLKQARIIDPASPHHLKTQDILLENGVIKKISDRIEDDNATVIEQKGMIVSPGWMDLRANFRDPGFEYKEDLGSGASAAAAGGFTAVALLPETEPVIQSKSEVEYIRNASRQLPVDIYPLGALTRNLDGTDITEMYDMHRSGAIAFSNGNRAVKAGTMQRALLYAKGFDGLVCVQADEGSISAGGQMHEGYHSTLLGMKGIPAHAESIAINRDIELLRYTGGRLHFSHISTAGSVELIRKAKAEGLDVSCDVAAIQLLFEDDSLETYDTNFKVFPPFRGREHVEALRKGLLDGTIDAVVSDHHPEDTEHKEVEFDYAAFGVSSIQVVLPLLLKAIPEINDEKLVQVLSTGPRLLCKLALPAIKEDGEANLTVFHRDTEWILDRESNRSKSIYSPLWNMPLKGKVVGTYVKGKWNQV